MKSSPVSLRSKGRTSVRGAADPLPSRSARVGVRWPGRVLGGQQRQRVRSWHSVGSGADTRRSRCSASAFFKLPCQ